MKSTTKIEWADATINFWWGCTKVSPACTHCYAATMSAMRSKQFFGFTVEWGDGLPRGARFLPAHEEAFKLNKRAVKTGSRPRVFANSMSDWLDNQVPGMWLAQLLQAIHLTPQLDWLLLTKRPDNFFPRLLDALEWAMKHEEPQAFCDWIHQWINGSPPANVHIGVTVEDQHRADERIPLLLKIPAARRFLSMEPLLGPVNIVDHLLASKFAHCESAVADILTGKLPNFPWLDQIIVGGESGSKDSRPTHIEWARAIREQCQTTGVPFFFKQWGDWLPASQTAAAGCPPTRKYRGLKSTEGELMLRVGKAAAGRLLDGSLHDGMPEPVSVSAS